MAAAAGAGAAAAKGAAAPAAGAAAVQSAAYLALKDKNAALKKELAKLEKLAASVDSKESKAKSEQKVKDVAAVKAAFDHFDADASGFIDKAEFAALSADLGELLDDDELAAAVKEIDVSGDGKISFNEFIRWWATDNKKVGGKSAAKVALLKTKLKAREFKAVNNMLIRQLSAIKSNENEFVKHRIALSVGDFKDAKASVHAALSFAAPLPEAQMMGAPAVSHLTLALNATATQAAVEAEKKKIDDLIAGVGLPGKSEVDMKSRTISVWTAVPEDPFALAQQLGLDLKTFVREASISLELPFSPTDLVEAGGKPLADLIGLKFETKLEFRKALVHTLASTLPGAQDAAFGAFLENFNFSLAMGNVHDFLTGVLPPPGLNPAQAQAQVPPPLFMMAKGAKWLLKDDSRDKLAAMYTAALQGMPAEPADILKALKTVVDQPTQIAFHTASGVHFTVNLKGVLPLKAFPDSAGTAIAGAGGKVQH